MCLPGRATIAVLLVSAHASYACEAILERDLAKGRLLVAHTIHAVNLRVGTGAPRYEQEKMSQWRNIFNFCIRLSDH